MKYIVEEKTIEAYKAEKLAILHQLGFHVDKSIFDDATTEIRVDNIAHSIIVGRWYYENQ